MTMGNEGDNPFDQGLPTGLVDHADFELGALDEPDDPQPQVDVAEPDPEEEPDIPDGPLTMATLYRLLPSEARDEYDMAMADLLATLDRLPDSGVEPWMRDLQAQLDQDQRTASEVRREESAKG